MAAAFETNHSSSQKLRVLELYSGIGGMHWALKENELPCEIVAAADINNIANEIYKYNLKGVNILQKVIESITVQDLNKLSPDLITMSPPCQPFTRVGLQKDKTDNRTKSFFHVLDLLPKLSKLPSYIFLENVKGFETSDTHQHLIETLSRAGYHFQEFLVSPNQFGVPNSRLRYFMLAKLRTYNFNFPVKDGIRDDIPECMHPYLKHIISNNDKGESGQSSQLLGESTTNQTGSSGNTSNDTSTAATCVDSSQQELRHRCQQLCRPVSDYLEHQPEEYFTQYLLPEKFLKRFWSMDIIKKYGHHIEGAGSILQCSEESAVNLDAFKQSRVADEGTLQSLRSLHLRFFTPREVANLMCFPPEFEFPEHLNTVQRYRVLGNSVNVHVVSILLRLLCYGDEPGR